MVGAVNRSARVERELKMVLSEQCAHRLVAAVSLSGYTIRSPPPTTHGAASYLVGEGCSTLTR